MTGPESKCYISINKATKDTILPHTFNKQVDVFVPLDTFEVIKDELDSHISSKWTYHRLRLPLTAILEKDFFNKYIKTGNVVMLSKGRVEADNIYCLSDGKLRLLLSKESYERAGLVGRPAKFGGKKGQRRLVEFDLRSDKMMHGSKALERIIWSFTEVLTGSIDFLFCDLYQHKVDSQDVRCPILTNLGSVPRILQPQIVTSGPLAVPSFVAPEGAKPIQGGKFSKEMWKEWALDIHEWLGMVAIDADRINANDKVDPYLSTYQVPDPIDRSLKVVKLRWRGMIPAEFIHKMWTSLCVSISSKNLQTDVAWAALTVHGFENSLISWGDNAHSSLTSGENCYTILRTAGPDASTKSVDSTDAMEIDQLRAELQEAGEIDKNSQFLTFEVVGSQDEYS